MEDGVTEIQSLLSPHNLNPEDGSKREDDKEKEDGFVSTGKIEKVKEEDLSGEDTGKDGVAKDEEDGGSLIKNLISSFVTPMSPRTGKATEHENGNNGVWELEEGNAASKDDHGERRGVIDNNGVEGGLISNLISNFFRQSEGEGEGGEVENEDKEEEEVVVEKIKRVKTEKDANDGGGSIIHNIVSHLPTSLPDDAVPTADEATILINSIVRD